MIAKDFNIDLTGVVAWARTKPADATFVFVDNRHCFMAQYLHDVHNMEATVSTFAFNTMDDPNTIYRVPPDIADALSDTLEVTPRIGIQDKCLSFHTVADYLEARICPESP